MSTRIKMPKSNDKNKASSRNKIRFHQFEVCHRLMWSLFVLGLEWAYFRLAIFNVSFSFKDHLLGRMVWLASRVYLPATTAPAPVGASHPIKNSRNTK